MHSQQFNEFCNDMLAAYLGNNDPEALEFSPVLAKHKVNLETPEGDEIFQKAAGQVVTWIEGEYSFDQLTKANQNKIIGIEIANIVENYGAVTGQDIQQTEDGVMVSPGLLDKISTDLPSAVVEGLQTDRMIQALNPYDLLEQDLGVPFFDSFQAITKLRIKTLSDPQANIYFTFFIGIEKRHSWLENDNFFARFVSIVYGKDLCNQNQVNVDMAERINISTMALDDLLTALGRIDREFDPITNELLLSRADALALDKVHRPKHSSWSDMVDALPEIDR
jgi:hypothetical protein